MSSGDRRRQHGQLGGAGPHRSTPVSDGAGRPRAGRAPPLPDDAGGVLEPRRGVLQRGGVGQARARPSWISATRAYHRAARSNSPRSLAMMPSAVNTLLSSAGSGGSAACSSRRDRCRAAAASRYRAARRWQSPSPVNALARSRSRSAVAGAASSSWTACRAGRGRRRRCRGPPGRQRQPDLEAGVSGGGASRCSTAGRGSRAGRPRQIGPRQPVAGKVKPAPARRATRRSRRPPVEAPTATSEPRGGQAGAVDRYGRRSGSQWLSDIPAFAACADSASSPECRPPGRGLDVRV